MLQAKIRVGLVLVVLTTLSVAGLLWGQGRVDRDIVYSEENGQCVLTSSPTRAVAKRNFVIIWRVTNHCTQEITVNVGNFRLSGAEQEPLDLTDSATVEAGKRGLISGLVKNDAPHGTYTYDVSLEGSEADDPELVINP